jgi:hypothetical protein
MIVVYLIGVFLAFLVIKDFLSFHKKDLTKDIFGWVILICLFSWAVIFVYVIVFIMIKIDNIQEDNEI